MINPMGRGSTVLMLPEVRRSLDIEYSKLQEKITLVWYSFQDKFFIAHVKIPSRSVDKLFYDVLIEINIDSIPQNSTIINGGSARVFSNCPSFTFTYAKVFNDKGDLIDWTKRKYSEEVFENDPVKRNPMKILSYERSLYFAIKYITTNGRNYKNKVNYHINKIESHISLLNLIKSSDEILELYRKGKKKQDEKERSINKSREDKKKKEVPQRKQTQRKSNISSKSVKSSTKTKSTSKTTKTKSMTHTKISRSF
jgi:hypothetical protein